MAGYTRQDTANNIANGNVIDADDFDAESMPLRQGLTHLLDTLMMVLQVKVHPLLK